VEVSRLMLDTTAISAYFKGHEDIRLSMSSADEIYLNPIVIGELLAGFIMGSREERNRQVLEEFIASPRVRFIYIDEETSERYAAILAYLREQGSPVPTNDLWIAASAMQYGLKVLTTDRHYLEIPQIITEHH
jgi:tRNA(fMet)-specific endonuclease VapC